MTAETDTNTVFICHSSADKPFVRRVAKALTDYGAEVWIDEAEIRVGDSLIQKIEDAIGTCRWFVAVLTANSINSNWVRKELQSALARDVANGTNRILPIIYGEIDIPLFIAELKYADFNKGFDSGIADLVDTLVLMEHFSTCWQGGRYGVRHTKVNVPFWFPLRAHELATSLFPLIIACFRDYYSEWEGNSKEQMFTDAIQRVNDRLKANGHEFSENDVAKVIGPLLEWVYAAFRGYGVIDNDFMPGLMGEAIPWRDAERLMSSEWECVFSPTYGEYTIVENGAEPQTA